MNKTILKMYPKLYYVFILAIIILYSLKPMLSVIYQNIYDISEYEAIKAYKNVHLFIFLLIQITSALTLYLSVILIKNPHKNLTNRITPIFFAIISTLELMLLVAFISFGGHAPGGMLG